jgi:hypothetical protein
MTMETRKITMPMSDPVRYRVGGSWGVTVVVCEDGKPDRLMGTMQTKQDAELVVEALNVLAQIGPREDDPIRCAVLTLTNAGVDFHRCGVCGQAGPVKDGKPWRCPMRCEVTEDGLHGRDEDELAELSAMSRTEAGDV